MQPQDLGIGRLFESVRDAIVVAEANSGQIILWNQAATEIFGYSRAEAFKLRVEALVPAYLKERHRSGMLRYLETGHGHYIDSHAVLDLPALRKTGEEIRIEMTLSPISPVHGSGSEGRFVLAIIRDVTERKRIEEALRESEEQFRALIQNALDLVTVTEADGTIRYISPSAKRVLGYLPEEMIGTNTADYVHPDDVEKAFGEFAEALAKPGVHSVAVETRFLHKDGSWRWLEGIANNMLNDPITRGVVFNSRDVTDRKQAERDLSQRASELAIANAELEQFAYSISHDLQAPLRSTISFSQILLEDYADELDEEGKDYLGRVVAAGQRMSQMMEGLLTLSRLMSVGMRRETVSLRALAESIVQGLQQSAPERSVKFAMDGNLMVEGDRRLLKTLLENLMANAWKFTLKQPRARIELGTFEQGGVAAYFVRDNGVGFDMNYAGKLFGVFQRLHGADEFEGMGLGLAAVARIVRRHGGQVWAEGEVGRGATIYFTLQHGAGSELNTGQGAKNERLEL
ncbi:MAG: PAS domain S-box protein [Actinomycetota bacterium]|nr:PAS domain S-box protein [Actinomycetota bacterium]